MTAPTDPAHALEVERWRKGRLEALLRPTGWFSLVGLHWLREGENGVGSDPSNRVTLPEGRAPAFVGVIELRDGAATFRAASGVPVTREGRPVTEVALGDDADGQRPTSLAVGPLRFYVIAREGRLGVRVKDTEAPARLEFRGIEHWPVQARWRLLARLEPADPGRSILMPDVLGPGQTFSSPGTLAFEVAGTTHRLDAVLEPGESDLFVVFGDGTNGRETFGGGRYVYTSPPGPDGTVVLDFNKAYNPPCVFTSYATCTLPPPQNRLAFPITAGEKMYGGAAHEVVRSVSHLPWPEG